jgi:hypothetical protein
MDQLLADLFGISKPEMDRWMQPGRYVSGRELAQNGLAELVELKQLKLFEKNGAAGRRKPSRAGR